uniref:Uncharacterized protein n=1 Tax=Capra hircus TaxID=9925 RepID=A0A8C2PHQ5_CAPHI
MIFSTPLKHIVRIKTRKRSWMMRVIARRSPNQHSWGPPYGTKPFPMTEIPSSWNTWTWRSFCRKMAFPPARLSMTTAPTLRGCSRPPQRPLPSWTSAVGPPHPFTLASHPQTVCRAPCDQASCCQPTAILRAPSTPTPSRCPWATSRTRPTSPSPASLARRCLTLANASSPRKS